MVIAAPPVTAPPAAAPETRVVSLLTHAPHGWTTHRVRPGETLVSIAARHRTTPGVLAARNHITSSRHLWAGSVIAVPATRAPASTVARSTRSLGTYTVHTGDTLWGIADRHGMSVPSLAKANHLSPAAVLSPGQRLRVRGGAGTAPTRDGATTRATTVTVRAGDTLSAIALRRGTSVVALAKANRISARSVIRAGQQLRVPARRARTSSHVEGAGTARYPTAVVRNAARNRAVLGGRAVPGRAQTRDLIVRTARRHGVDPALALAIGMRESGWNQRAVSDANAIGVMQVIPASGRWASQLHGRTLDLLDTQDNVTAGVVMLRALTRMADNDTQAIAAYYQGLGSVQSRGLYDDTKAYVRGVRALRARM